MGDSVIVSRLTVRYNYGQKHISSVTEKRDNMKSSIRRTAAFAALLSMLTALSAPLTVTADYGAGGNGTAVMEYLDRGIYAVKSGNGMFVSWRWNADDDDNAEFRLYRDDQLIYTSKSGNATSYQDNGGNAKSQYRVDTVVNGSVVSTAYCKFNSGTNYFDIPLNSPGSNYSPNDCCVGDVDGDGQYEIFLKWDPNDSQDNSKSGYTSNVYIDCVTLTGQTLWRVDLGKNIRAGQHYTQMCVADFDGDGHAELITKTADGTKDGQGKVIGDGSKDYHNSSGYVLDGPEYMTLFDGQTGAALDTINFPVPRGNVSDWGDKYGNRVDRFNSGIAYLDGVHPSAIYNRGYYTRMTVSALDVVNGKLSVRWIFDSNNNGSGAAYGQGNHNLMVGDVDNDGKQEISMGDCVIDDNGKLLWSSGKGHGDAQHLGDFIPERPGLELWQAHEHTPYGVTLFDASNGQTIFHHDADKDTGRCCADNIYAGNAGAEFWGARPAKAVLDKAGKTIASLSPSMNFLIYWDGDLEREMLSDIYISKMTSTTQIDYIFSADGCASNNSTKAVPCMTADLFGDWREELIMRTSDNKKLRIWCTTTETKVRLTTLMHDMQYRAQDCCQQSAYNQPPHTSYYLGSDAPLPERPNVVVNGKTTAQPPAPSHKALTEEYLVGDLNGDGAINAVDYTLMKRELLSSQMTRVQRQPADLDADGTVSVADAVIMQKYLMCTGEIDAAVHRKAFYHAIDAAYGKGVEESVNAGFREQGYVNLDNVYGSFLEWQVFVPESGSYVCTFGFANGSSNNRPMTISVNGEVHSQQNYAPTGAWTAWTESSITLTLDKGKNLIRMTSASAEGGPNLDYLSISKDEIS